MMITVDAPAQLNGEQLADELAVAGQDVAEVVLSGGKLEIVGERLDQDTVQGVVAAHAPAPSPVDQARTIRDDRSAAVATPTAQLLDSVAFYLDEERGQTQPDSRWVTVLEALRQLGLKGVADEAVETGSDTYAEIYTARVNQP